MDYLTAKAQAVKYIGLSKKTEEEVRNKLLRLNVEDDVINSVIDDLISIGYIDDVVYTNLYIKQCLKELKKSKFEISQKLLQKGIKECIIEEGLCNIPDEYEDDLREKIIKVKSKNLSEQDIKMYLIRRGLSDEEWY